MSKTTATTERGGDVGQSNTRRLVISLQQAEFEIAPPMEHIQMRKVVLASRCERKLYTASAFSRTALSFLRTRYVVNVQL